MAEAYRAAGARDPRGEAFLFLEVPPHLVDVNVHPGQDRGALRRAAHGLGGRGARRARGAVAGGARRARRRADERRRRSAAAGAARVRRRSRWRVRGRAPRSAARSADGGGRPRPLLEAAPPTVLGQHRNTYIVATDGEDLLLVDQHTAHERVRFEALRRRAGARARVESQLLLVPAGVHARRRGCGPCSRPTQATLRALGFDVEPFGGDAVRVRAVPAVLGGARSRRRPGGAAARPARARGRGVGGGRRRATAWPPPWPATPPCAPASRWRREAMRAIVAGPLARRAARALPARPAHPRARPARRREPLVRPRGLAAASEAPRAQPRWAVAALLLGRLLQVTGLVVTLVAATAFFGTPEHASRCCA